MYSLPSASNRREPSPRTMKGASPPTAPKARTGEFTPPGIIFSARFCSLRGNFNPDGPWTRFALRDSTNIAAKQQRSMGRERPRALPALAERLSFRAASLFAVSNLPQIHVFATLLQHPWTSLNTVTCSSNRKSSGQSRGAPGCPFFPSLTAQDAIHREVSLDIPAQYFDQVLRGLGLPGVDFSVLVENMKPDFSFDDFDQ